MCAGGRPPPPRSVPRSLYFAVRSAVSVFTFMTVTTATTTTATKTTTTVFIRAVCSCSAQTYLLRGGARAFVVAVRKSLHSIICRLWICCAIFSIVIKILASRRRCVCCNDSLGAATYRRNYIAEDFYSDCSLRVATRRRN